MTRFITPGARTSSCDAGVSGLLSALIHFMTASIPEKGEICSRDEFSQNFGKTKSPLNTECQRCAVAEINSFE
jgi:hypothetical protein